MKAENLLVVLLLCLIGLAEGQCGRTVTTFESGLSPLRDVHVTTTGTPSGTGTQNSPLNLPTAFQRAQPGDNIIIHAGSYNGNIYSNNLAGNSTAPIWIGGAQGEAMPVIGSSGNSNAIQCSACKWVIFHNLEITAAEGNGINCDDASQRDDQTTAHHLIYRNLYMHDIGSGGNSDCLKLTGLNHFFVLDSVFSDCSANAGSAIDHVGCHYGVIARNNFTRGGNGVQCKGGSLDIEIKWNTFTQISVNSDSGPQSSINLGGSTGLEFFRPPLSTTTANYDGKNIRAFANVFDRDYTPVSFINCVDCVFAQNTVVGSTTRIVRVLPGTIDPSVPWSQNRNGTVANNLIQHPGLNAFRLVNVGPDSNPTEFTWTNNLWWASGTASAVPQFEGGTVSGQIYNQDPGLSNISSIHHYCSQFTANLYRISTSSPASGAGQNRQYISADYEGRCFGSPPSIGAYEPRTVSGTSSSTTSSSSSTSTSTSTSSTSASATSSSTSTSSTSASSSTSSTTTTSTSSSTSTSSTSAPSSTSSTATDSTSAATSTTTATSSGAVTGAQTTGVEVTTIQMTGSVTEDSISVATCVQNSIAVFLYVVLLLNVH